jgi:hypothetical protein
VSYDETIARKIFQYSKVSYCSGDKIQSWSCGPDCDKLPGMRDITLHSNSKAGTQGYTGYHPAEKAIIVAFRGSSNIPNWVNNIKAYQRIYPGCSGCKVHAGFDDSYHSLSGVIIPAVVSLYKKYKAEIVVTGHSLGAAMTTLAALDIQAKTGIKVGRFYNFESPRMGNQAFAEYFAQQVPSAYRLTHYKDVVVHLPPMALGLSGFIHFAPEIWYNSPSTSYTQCNTAESNKCANSMGGGWSISDHLNVLGQYTGCTTDVLGNKLAAVFKLAKAAIRISKVWDWGKDKAMFSALEQSF